MPSGTPMTDNGIEKTVNANVNAVTEPVARPDAERGRHEERDLGRAERDRARPHQAQRLADVGIARRRGSGVNRKPMRRERRKLDEEVPERAGNDADREARRRRASASG